MTLWVVFFLRACNYLFCHDGRGQVYASPFVVEQYIECLGLGDGFHAEGNAEYVSFFTVAGFFSRCISHEISAKRGPHKKHQGTLSAPNRPYEPLLRLGRGPYTIGIYTPFIPYIGVLKLSRCKGWHPA